MLIACFALEKDLLFCILHLEHTPLKTSFSGVTTNFKVLIPTDCIEAIEGMNSFHQHQLSEAVFLC
jgi:hypothetical protein